VVVTAAEDDLNSPNEAEDSSTVLAYRLYLPITWRDNDAPDDPRN
jgi:hypothetical protein